MRINEITDEVNRRGHAIAVLTVRVMRRHPPRVRALIVHKNCASTRILPRKHGNSGRQGSPTGGRSDHADTGIVAGSARTTGILAGSPATPGATWARGRAAPTPCTASCAACTSIGRACRQPRTRRTPRSSTSAMSGTRPSATTTAGSERKPRRALLRDDERPREIYPDLAAATTAPRRIRNGDLADGFDRFDRIVIDERRRWSWSWRTRWAGARTTGR